MFNLAIHISYSVFQKLMKSTLDFDALKDYMVALWPILANYSKIGAAMA